jgi:hypothetical protein
LTSCPLNIIAFKSLLDESEGVCRRGGEERGRERPGHEGGRGKTGYLEEGTHV